MPCLVSWSIKYPGVARRDAYGPANPFVPERPPASIDVPDQHEQDNHLAHNGRFDLTPGSIR